MAGLSDLAALAANNKISLAPDKQSRKAGQVLQISQSELEDLILPWEEYERDSSLPNYYGRNEQEWKADNSRVRSELINAQRDGESRGNLLGILNRSGFTNELENRNILNNLNNDTYRGLLHTEKMWVPGAAGDEELSKALLDYSGFTPVSLENANGDPMATDLRVTIDGAPRYVDAQQRTSTSNLPIDLTKYTPNAVRRIVEAHPGDSLSDLTRRIRDAFPKGLEGKMLHTNDSDINPIMSRKIRSNPNYAKDYLISSNRKGDLQRGYGQGPYDRQRPLDWDLVDLRKAREILMPLTRGQMMDKYGVQIRQGRYGGSVQLHLPERFLKDELEDTSKVLDPYAKFRLTRSKGQRR